LKEILREILDALLLKKLATLNAIHLQSRSCHKQLVSEHQATSNKHITILIQCHEALEMYAVCHLCHHPATKLEAFRHVMQKPRADCHQVQIADHAQLLCDQKAREVAALNYKISLLNSIQFIEKIQY
jgi:hypothetical protein